MNWLWSLIEDMGRADSVREWLGVLMDHQFTFALIMLSAFGVWWLLSKRNNFGTRPKMKQVESGMDEGWQTPSEVKQTGLYE